MLLQRNTRLFPLLLLSTSVTLNAAKFSFLSSTSNSNLKPGGPLKWKKRLVKDARLSLPLTEVVKIVSLTSPLPDMPRLSSPRPRLGHGRRLALLSHLNLTLNLCTLYFVLSLALLLHLFSVLTFPTVFLPECRLRSPPFTRDPRVLSPSQRPSVAKSEAIFPSSAEPRALRSLICPFALPSSLLNFLRLPQTSPGSLPLAQTKLTIPC